MIVLINNIYQLSRTLFRNVLHSIGSLKKEDLMNDRQIQCFVQAATYLNFHKAAEKLFISQPAMTYQIRSLESELGFSLFERTNKRVSLTPAGESLYHNLIQINATLNRAVSEARSQANSLSRRFTLAWPPSIFDRSLATALAERFQRENEGIEVTFTVSDRKNSLAMLEEGAADVTFTLENDVSQHEGIISLPLFEATRACLVNESHPLASNQFITWETLKTQKILLMPREYYPPSYESTMRETSRHIPHKNILFFEDVAAIDLNIVTGKGVGIRPVRTEQLLRATNEMVAIPLYPYERHSVCAAYLDSGKNDDSKAFGLFAQGFFE